MVSSVSNRGIFRQIQPYLVHRKDLGLAFCGSHVESLTDVSCPSGLKYYAADPTTTAIIDHNLKWAIGERAKPAFQFAYLMLPTLCNQACRGCFMGQDKRLLPGRLKGSHFDPTELDSILSFLREHSAKAVVYGGGGELFTWSGAFSLIRQIVDNGLAMVIFTNGVLLRKDDVDRLNDLGVSLIVSMRDTVEAYHDSAVGRKGFRATLETIDNALAAGFQEDQRLAVEIPVTTDNDERVINDFLPVMRALGIVPLIEEYIQLSTSAEEKRLCHSFAHSRRFFERACEMDRSLGFRWKPEFGQRIIAQPRCRRPLYSFAVFPSRDVVDCPSHTTCYGNLHQATLSDIIYSDRFRQALLAYQLCPCSVFYTPEQAAIPPDLPDQLEDFV